MHPPSSENVLRASGSEDMYGDDTNALRWQAADQSHRRDSSRAATDNAVFRKTVEPDQDVHLKGELIREESAAIPQLSAPMDDPYADRKLSLRTEHNGSEAPSKNALRTPTAPPRRARDAGFQTQEPIQDPYQENNDPAKRQDPAEISLRTTTCDAYRQELLNRPIDSLDINISAPGPNAQQSEALKRGTVRSWTDRYGNEIANGKFVELRRGYAIIDTGSGLQPISTSRLSDSDLAAIADVWRIPVECTFGDLESIERCWAAQTYTWKASELCHKPLYFEDEQLERYGHSAGPVLQPLKSTAHFFVRLAACPYMKGIHPPNECQYALGFYRPGNCAPWLCDPLPLSLSGATHAAAAYASAAYILP